MLTSSFTTHYAYVKGKKHYWYCSLPLSFIITSPVYVIIALILVVFASFSPSFLSFAKISSGIVKNPSMYLDYRSSGQAKIWFKNFSMKDILLLKNNGWKLRVDFFPGTGGIFYFVDKKRHEKIIVFLQLNRLLLCFFPSYRYLRICLLECWVQPSEVVISSKHRGIQWGCLHLVNDVWSGEQTTSFLLISVRVRKGKIN